MVLSLEGLLEGMPPSSKTPLASLDPNSSSKSTTTANTPAVVAARKAAAVTTTGVPIAPLLIPAATQPFLPLEIVGIAQHAAPVSPAIAPIVPILVAPKAALEIDGMISITPAMPTVLAAALAPAAGEPRDWEADAASLERDGFVIIRGALDPQVADELRAHVDAQLVTTLAAFTNGDIEQEEAFGAIAPPAQAMIPNRWNLLLPMDALTQKAISGVLDHTGEVFQAACGDEAVLCDLSALITDPGALKQRLHYDTRYSDAESDSEEEEEDAREGRGVSICEGEDWRARLRVSRQVRLITAFVALQDVSEAMGPTFISPGTATSDAHEALMAAADEEAVSAVLAGLMPGGSEMTLAKGDAVLMDSRAFHRGSANQSEQRRTLLDFAFVGKKCVPSTYCECIKSELKGRFPLRDFGKTEA